MMQSFHFELSVLLNDQVKDDATFDNYHGEVWTELDAQLATESLFSVDIDTFHARSVVTDHLVLTQTEPDACLLMPDAGIRSINSEPIHELLLDNANQNGTPIPDRNLVQGLEFLRETTKHNFEKQISTQTLYTPLPRFLFLPRTAARTDLRCSI